MANDWTASEKELNEQIKRLYELDERKPSKPLDKSFMQEAAEPVKIKESDFGAGSPYDCWLKEEITIDICQDK